MNLKKYIKIRKDIDAEVHLTEEEELLFQQLLQKVKTGDIEEKAEAQEEENDTGK